MLLPAKAEVARQLRRYRAWERVMLAAPHDRTVRTTFEDSGYTLCVLMGKRCAREAADAAERYLSSHPAGTLPETQVARLQEPQLTRLREPGERPRAAAAAIARRAPAAERLSPVAERRAPAAERRSPAGR
ncbi:DUF5133 domain-containing protein [Streptomyces sp. bgisy032]|uniref:DUF5133 domain-containing protein n=1 Tax=Streptomyces sp. bgisy032 TaxID=3413773 RepID=UPI003D71D622